MVGYEHTAGTFLQCFLLFVFWGFVGVAKCFLTQMFCSAVTPHLICVVQVNHVLYSRHCLQRGASHIVYTCGEEKNMKLKINQGKEKQTAES